MNSQYMRLDIGVDDLKELFRFWEFAQPPIEFCEYNLDNTEYYSKHWSLLLRNL